MKKLFKISLVVILFTSPLYTLAQGFEDDEDVVDVPLDGGVSALAIAGVAYGIKKLKNLKDLKK